MASAHSRSSVTTTLDSEAYEHVDAIILTVSTFNRGALAAGAGGFCSVPGGGWTVPVISTLCPMCVASFASSESRRYSLAVVFCVG
jgi:hypothetical protein